MEPTQSDERRKQLRRSHEIFAVEAVDFFQQYYQFKPNEDNNFAYMTKATGDAITTISYLFRNETWRMCKDMREYLIRDDNFANYCRVIKVDGGSRFFYNYLRRVSLILEMASFCFMKGHDFFNIASKYIAMYEYTDLQLFEERGGWTKLYRLAEFIGSCGNRLNMVMIKEEPSRKPERFIETVSRLEPLYTTDDSNYCDCFPYVVEIKWKLVIDSTVPSEDSESSSSSDGDDPNPPDASSRVTFSKVAMSARESTSESAEGEPRPSTSRAEVTSSKEVKDSRIQIEGDDEKAVLDYLLRCCCERKKMGHLGESNDSEASNANSASTESEAENVLECIMITSSDSEDELNKTLQLQLIDLKDMRRKRSSGSSAVSGLRGKGTLRSASAVADDEPHCSGEKIRKLSGEPSKFMVESDTSADELGTTPDEKSEQSPE